MGVCVFLWLCAICVCAVCACMCVANLLIALILRHMHRHARLATSLSSLPSLRFLSLSHFLLLCRLLLLPSLIYSGHPFTRNIHVRRSTALLNLLPDAVAAVALPRLRLAPSLCLLLCSLSLLIVLHTFNMCVCVCVFMCQRVRASVDKAQKSYTC